MSQPLLEYIKGRLNAEAPAPLYIQLKQAIEAAMTERLLTHGSILPSERKMSQTLELSRDGGEGAGCPAGSRAGD